MYEIEPDAQPYYGRQTLTSAIQQAKETIAEWDYHQDPHGYCHVRPMLIALVRAVDSTYVPEEGS